MRQKHRRDPDVIIDDLAFGEACLWIENFVESGNGYGLSVDVEGRFSFWSRRLRARTSGNSRAIRCPWFHLKILARPFQQYCTLGKFWGGPNVTLRMQVNFGRRGNRYCKFVGASSLSRGCPRSNTKSKPNYTYGRARNS